MSRLHPRWGFLVALIAAASPAPSRAQAPDASLRIVVADDTGAVIVGARVLVAQSGATRGPVATGNRGDAVVGGLVPGPAEIRVESDGFEPFVSRGRQLRPGSNRFEIRLQIARLAVRVEVMRDALDRQTDPRGDAFTRVLTPADIAQLPDDPDDMKRVLEQMAGPGAVIRVNGFSGGRFGRRCKAGSARPVSRRARASRGLSSTTPG